MSSMVCSDKKLTNVVGGKSVRACDTCVKKRARWYCAADDAFLCQSCDSSVHSANPLARRHERVRLKIVSPIKGDEKTRSMLRVSVPTWHRGFTRKPRTPRQHKKARLGGINRLVPEISGEENEEQLLYRVPIFDPFVAEMCGSGSINSNAGSKPVSQTGNLNGFLPSEMDLDEFAADVESLLGKGLEEEVFDMEGLGILDCEDERERRMRERVKVEEEEIGEVINDDGVFIGMGRETFELNFDYDYAITGEEEDEDYKEKNVDPIMATRFQDSDPLHDVKTTKIFSLRLDYKGVISAWDDHKSPWTTGVRPELNPADECWPHCMGTCGTIHVYGDMGAMNGHAAAMGDGGREARVSRYREKRRTRLFSKKIRYEVRKLNAEKRPRMKGRFVKRANVVGSSLSMVNK